STASFVQPYGLVGATAASSVIGTSTGLPYTAAVELNTRRETPAARTASSRASEPTTLVCQYSSGRWTDSPAAIFAAKCSTPSNPASAVSTAPTSWTARRWNAT